MTFSFIQALLKQPVEYTPTWLMRQAGRYLPEYRQTRTQAGNFLTLCKTPELACQVTLQPLERYPLLDAAILFSDILTIPDAMGLDLYFAEGEGPKFAKPLRSEADIQRMKIPDMHETLSYVFDAVRLIRQEMPKHLPLIGFSGSPWTLACYMIEGGGSDDFRLIKQMMYQRPDLLHYLLEILADTIAEYLNEQIRAGVNAVQIFDTWGGILTDHAFHTFSLQYSQRVIRQLIREHNHQTIPVILFTKGGGQWLEAMSFVGADALGVDWTVNLMQAKQHVGQQVALQGHLDPMILLSTPVAIRQEVRRVLDSFGEVTLGQGHVFNLGHGISLHTPPEHVAILLDEVQSYSRQFHVIRH